MPARRAAVAGASGSENRRELVQVLDPGEPPDLVEIAGLALRHARLCRLDDGDAASPQSKCRGQRRRDDGLADAGVRSRDHDDPHRPSTSARATAPSARAETRPAFTAATAAAATRAMSASPVTYGGIV